VIEWRVVLKRGPAAWILILTARPEAAPYMAQMRESAGLSEAFKLPRVICGCLKTVANNGHNRGARGWGCGGRD
jgi:hypothetical protein